MRKTPEYLEAPDNEDSEAICEYCPNPADDDARYPELCWECNEQAAVEEYYERLAEDQQDREWDDQDYFDYELSPYDDIYSEE